MDIGPYQPHPASTNLICIAKRPGGAPRRGKAMLRASAGKSATPWRKRTQARKTGPIGREPFGDHEDGT